MEEHQSAAHTTPEAEQQPPPPAEQQQVELAVAVSPAAAENGDGSSEGGDGSAPEAVETSLLLGGPRRTGLHLFVMNIRSVFKLDELGAEVLGIAVPASLALTADPLASLIDTAFIGRLGSVEIAAVGVAIAVFNQVMKVCIYPLVSVTTSFVAEEDAILSKGGAKVVDGEEEETEDPNQHAAVGATDPEKQQSAEEAAKNCGSAPPSAVSGDASPDELARAEGCAPAVVGKKSGNNRRFVPSVTSALIVGAFLGLFQTVLLVAAAPDGRQVGQSLCPQNGGGVVPRFLAAMGNAYASVLINFQGSSMMTPALRYLTLRALGAPAVLLSLAMQGVFRGFKDTKTPLYATVAGDLANIVLDPILIFGCRMGVIGAAIAHVLSQYLITLIMLSKLVRKVDVVPPSLRCLKFRRFLGCGFLLLARVVAVTFCVTLAASLAARHGPTAMAAFQICSQVWLATSLLADGLAVAGQAMIASAFAKKDHYKVAATTARVLQLGIVLGAALTVVLGLGMQFGAGIFTKDAAVIKTIQKGVPFVAGTQTLNTLAFVFDGINFGASDYAFAAYSMVGVAAVSIPSLIVLSSHGGFVGIWIALTIYMSVRALASTWRMGAARGPWKFLRQ
ncbi:Protein DETOXIFICATION 42 [Dichanthelium oligosanthes]|uniref:Protein DETOXIFICATION n=1 Tax=Dichanthelium oligosanthes TaxID=888268 RepID=A0A1E5V7J8_9POAL|nr:Protein DETOXIFICATION 42 [Dichanthelium oligosanthes]